LVNNNLHLNRYIPETETIKTVGVRTELHNSTYSLSEHKAQGKTSFSWMTDT